jgi:L-glyceraldehyde reductase
MGVYYADPLVRLAWAQIGGHSVIPKSITPSRIVANFQDVNLSQSDVETIDKLGRNPIRYNIPYVASES